jgi:hypothetical protein
MNTPQGYPSTCKSQIRMPFLEAQGLRVKELGYDPRRTVPKSQQSYHEFDQFYSAERIFN